ncbi:MAG: hypothetical protein HY822_18240 [Acidobacteria bacterium]|nr:hypothetical protein [Acidobacteriota bacterium]
MKLTRILENKRSLLLVCALALTLPVLSVIGYRHARNQFLLFSQAPNQAMTVVTQDKTLCGNGPAFNSIRFTTAFRQDGARVIKTEMLTRDGRADQVDRRIELSDGTNTPTHDEAAVMSRYKMNFDQLRLERLDPNHGCMTSGSGYPLLNAVLLGYEDVGGYKTAKIKLSGSDRQETSWLALDLGCVQIKRHIEFYDNKGAVASQSDLELVSVTFREPDPILFDTTGIRNVPPSERGTARQGVILAKMQKAQAEEHRAKIRKDLEANDKRWKLAQ